MRTRAREHAPSARGQTLRRRRPPGPRRAARAPLQHTALFPSGAGQLQRGRPVARDARGRRRRRHEARRNGGQRAAAAPPAKAAASSHYYSSSSTTASPRQRQPAAGGEGRATRYALTLVSRVAGARGAVPRFPQAVPAAAMGDSPPPPRRTRRAREAGRGGKQEGPPSLPSRDMARVRGRASALRALVFTCALFAVAMLAQSKITYVKALWKPVDEFDPPEGAPPHDAHPCSRGSLHKTSHARRRRESRPAPPRPGRPRCVPSRSRHVYCVARASRRRVCITCAEGGAVLRARGAARRRRRLQTERRLPSCTRRRWSTTRSAWRKARTAVVKRGAHQRHDGADVLSPLLRRGARCVQLPRCPPRPAPSLPLAPRRATAV